MAGRADNVFTEALEAIDEGFAVWDAEDRLVVCNDSYRRQFGANARFVSPGARFEDLMRLQLESGILRVRASRPHDWIAQRTAAHRGAEEPWEDEFSDGTWVSVTETNTESGLTVSICRDVSHIRRREIALKTFAENNRRLAAAVNATTSAILITDPKRPGNPTVFANPAFSAMTGWPIEEALGRDRSFLNGDDTDLDAVARFERELTQGHQASAELCLRARNGGPLWVDLNASPIRGADGRIANWVIVQTDVTARKTREAQVRKAAKPGSGDPSTGVRVHDLNNLLAVARGNLEAAAEMAGAGDPQVAAMLESALAAIDRGAGITRSLLGSPATPESAPGAFDLGDALRGFQTFIGHALGRRYSFRIAGAAATWPVVADHGQIQDAILNLAINARDAMPDGGTVALEAANAVVKDATDATGWPVADGDYVRVSVRDSGTGMEPDIIRQVVEPYFTTKDPGRGTGLGLSAVGECVARSGGFLTIDSAPHRGTTVSLFLPRASVERPVAAPRQTDSADSGETILVVDDEPDVRAVVALHLARLGYRILQAGSAEEALRFLDGDRQPDLLMTDIGLRGGMDGYQLVEAYRARRPDARVIVMSGSCDQALAEAVKRLPDVRFFPKPYDRAALATAVRQELDVSEMPAPDCATPAAPA